MLFMMHSLMQYSGLASVYAARRGAIGATILMYHSVADDADAAWIDPCNRMDPVAFRRQMTFLARRRHVVSMDDLSAAIREGRALPRGSVAITIDDGYRDALTVAAPILAELGLPAIVYLATGYVARMQNQWIDQLYSLFSARTADRIRAPLEPEDRDLRRFPARVAAYRAIARRLLASSRAERESMLNDLEAQLRPSSLPPRLTLSWNEVRALRKEYPSIAIGGHTRDHVDLSSMGVDEAGLEIAACAMDIESELGERPRHFSFPYNRTGPGLERSLERGGFVSAVASGPAVLVGPGNSCYALPRIEAPRSDPRLKFYTSGAYPALSLALTGRC
jgi:peptidoglycan/xylan/chitin deacetylase (PgdA/CDA1 family)